MERIIYLFIYLFIYSFIHSFTHSFSIECVWLTFSSNFKQISNVQFYYNLSEYIIVFTIQSQVFFNQQLIILTLFYFAPPFSPALITIFLSLFMSFSQLNFTLFISYFPNLSPLTPVSLSSVSMTLFVFCLFVCFVYQVINISGFIWQFSFSDLLILLSTIYTKAIPIVPKVTFSSYLWLRNIQLCTYPHVLFLSIQINAITRQNTMQFLQKIKN